MSKFDRKPAFAEFAAILVGVAMLSSAVGQDLVGPERTQIKASEASPDAEFGISHGHKLQANGWAFKRWNIEAAPANFFRQSRARWFKGGRMKNVEADPAILDPISGLPQRLDDGTSVSSDYFFDMRGFGGEWVVEAIGDDVMLKIWGRRMKRISDARVEFTIGETEKASMFVTITRIGDGGLQDILLYKKEDEARVKSGKHWSTQWIEECSGYHVFRSMDYQLTNGTFVNRADYVADMNMAHWGDENTGPYNSTSPNLKATMPLEALFAMGVECDNEIWFQVPVHMGFPFDWKSPELLSFDGSEFGQLERAAMQEFETVLQSDEWDKYADMAVKALDASGYPADRLLHISLGNEVWNYGGPGFLIQTIYARGIGRAFDGGTDRYQERVGYGVLFARMMTAFEDAFARAGRDQNVVYVMEAQAANAYQGRKSYVSAKAAIEEKFGRKWGTFSPKMGLSIASYWGSKWDKQMDEASWLAAIDADHDAAAKARADFLINGPANVTGTRAWVLKTWAQHEKFAAEFGVRVHGAYEGGNHDVRKPNYIPVDFYQKYAWGPEGARVNEAVNDALLAKYPDFILSNYVVAGNINAGGSPWADGPIGDPNPINQSWNKYKKKVD